MPVHLCQGDFGEKTSRQHTHTTWTLSVALSVYFEARLSPSCLVWATQCGRERGIQLAKCRHACLLYAGQTPHARMMQLVIRRKVKTTFWALAPLHIATHENISLSSGGLHLVTDNKQNNRSTDKTRWVKHNVEMSQAWKFVLTIFKTQFRNVNFKFLFQFSKNNFEVVISGFNFNFN